MAPLPDTDRRSHDIDGPSTSEAPRVMGNGSANGHAEASYLSPRKPKEHPMCTQWTSKVPVDTQVYGEKALDCSDEEWRARVDLAAAYRQCYRMGLCEGINNHLTAAIPGTSDRFLVFPFGLRWCEVTASKLLVVDSGGHVVSGKGEPEATAFYIHSRLHMRHPKGMAVFHTHQTWATALCALEDPAILMCNQNSLRFYEDWVWDGYSGLVLDNSEGDRLADVMGSKRVLLHQNHERPFDLRNESSLILAVGVIICAETIATCFDFMYYLERAAKVQVLAMSTGKPLHLVDEKVATGFKKTFELSGVKQEYGRLHFESLKREMLASPLDTDFIS